MARAHQHGEAHAHQHGESPVARAHRHGKRTDHALRTLTMEVAPPTGDPAHQRGMRVREHRMSHLHHRAASTPLQPDLEPQRTVAAAAAALETEHRPGQQHHHHRQQHQHQDSPTRVTMPRPRPTRLPRRTRVLLHRMEVLLHRMEVLLHHTRAPLHHTRVPLHRMGAPPRLTRALRHRVVGPPIMLLLRACLHLLASMM